MDGLAARGGLLVLWTALGGLLGWAGGGWIGQPALGSWLGALLGCGLGAGLDALKAWRHAAWLRGDQEAAAPRDAGFWGELGYLAEKAVRRRDRALAEEARRRDQFLSGIEASPNGVVLLDAGDGIEWCNSIGAEHFGLDRVRDIQQRITHLVRSPAFVAYLQAGVFDEPVQVPRPGGAGTLSVLVRGYGDGMKLVLSQDITERERADVMRRDFVANVSHEIRTPLTVLSGFVDTMANLPLSEAERRRVLELMGQQTLRMRSLVNDLLTLAQLEGSPRPTVDRWTALRPLMAQIELDAQALSAGRHAVTVQPAPDLQLAGAEAELTSAVSNLVSNAIRYTPEGGTVEVFSAGTADGGLEIAVSDSGIGIAREHIARLTERFYRVDGSRSRETGGTGLGLSIVKHVVQRHGGRLEVQSEPGRGSTFRIVLPATRVRPAPSTFRANGEPTAARLSAERVGEPDGPATTGTTGLSRPAPADAYSAGRRTGSSDGEGSVARDSVRDAGRSPSRGRRRPAAAGAEAATVRAPDPQAAPQPSPQGDADLRR